MTNALSSYTWNVATGFGCIQETFTQDISSLIRLTLSSTPSVEFHLHPSEEQEARSFNSADFEVTLSERAWSAVHNSKQVDVCFAQCASENHKKQKIVTLINAVCFFNSACVTRDCSQEILKDTFCPKLDDFLHTAKLRKIVIPAKVRDQAGLLSSKAA